MQSDERISPCVALRIVYEDLPDLIQIEARVVHGDWRGTVRAYASPDGLREDARHIGSWSRNPNKDCVLEAGEDNGIGWLQLRFYSVDLAGHLCCHVQLSESRPAHCRTQEIWRLSIEMCTEPGLIERFASELCAIIPTVGKEAILVGVHEERDAY